MTSNQLLKIKEFSKNFYLKSEQLSQALTGDDFARARALVKWRKKMTSDFQKIAENLQAALATEPLRSDFKNKYSSLLYLDLRYGNKVYFKFK